jgi:hypothetical protein
MISLGLRLTVNGGREAVVRLVLLVAAVGLGVGLLLTAVAGINAVNYQNDRYAWLNTTASSGSAAPTWWLLTGDRYDGNLIGRVDVAATGPDSPVPPGIAHLPGPGQYYASPAMIRLLDSVPADQLASRYPGHLIGTIGNQALPGPNSLLIIVGHTAAQLAATPGAVKAAAISTFAPSSCDGDTCQISQGIKASGIDLIFSVVALAMLFPVLIFIATATRLSAARREQRFAAMRLAGATPRQVSLIAGVESTAAAVLGVALGFALFVLVRVPIASIPFTGTPFFPSDLTLSMPDVLLVALGVPVAAAAAARFALRRVHISPLGVTRRVTPKPPSAWRVLPLLAGLAELGFFVVHGRPPSTQGQIQAFLPGFLLVMAGLVVAGPWLTMTGSRLLVRLTARPGTLIAARRLADNPRVGFRAVSGLVLALFVTTVAVALITTQDAKGSEPADGPGTSGILVAQLSGYSGSVHGPLPVPSGALLSRLGSIDGVQGVMTIRQDRGLTLPAAMFGRGRSYTQPVPAGLVSCAELARFPELGRCPAGAAVVAFPEFPLYGVDMNRLTWPAEDVPAAGLAGLPALSVNVGTNGSVAAIEQARTLLENTYPHVGETATIGERDVDSNGRDAQYQRLADVVILASLAIAGCTLAASIAAGLTDRKRPFSMLRLAGTPLAVLRRVVALESAVPLLVTAAVSIGIGFGTSAMFASMQLEHPMVAPDVAYYLITAAGILLSLGIIAATMPLLNRITGPDVARNELLEHVAAGGGRQRRVVSAAQRLARLPFGAGVHDEPLAPAMPPRAVLHGRAGQPLIRVRHRRFAVPAVVPGAVGRVHERLDVPGLDDRQLPRAAEQAGGAERGAPRRDVVGVAADVEAVAADPRQVDRGAENDRTRARRVGAELVDGDPGGLQGEPGRCRGGVVIPGEHVERGRLLTHQPAADQVVEHQVVRPEQGEQGAQRGTWDDLPGRRGEFQRGSSLAGVQHAHHVGVRSRRHGDDVRGGIGGLVADRGEVTQQVGDGHAAGAQAEPVQRVAAGDLPHHRRGAQQRGEVGVQAPAAVAEVAARVPPGDHEHLDALGDRELDDRPAGRQVEDVVPVHLRRHHQHRTGVHAGSGRRVLQQLEHLLPVHHRTRGAGDLLADRERLAVRVRRQPAASQVAQHVLGALVDRLAVRLSGAAQRDGIARQVVRG